MDTIIDVEAVEEAFRHLEGRHGRIQVVPVGWALRSVHSAQPCRRAGSALVTRVRTRSWRVRGRRPAGAFSAVR
jgi:hypothetical protein